jgi:tetratricopeptide (TPR) repeat protein
MFKTKQISIILAIFALMAILLVQPIKGLVGNSKESTSSAPPEPSEQVNLNSEFLRNKKGLNPSLIEEIEQLEKAFKEAGSDADKEVALQSLASKWDDLNKWSPLGFTREEIAKIQQTAKAWLAAGDAYREAYTNLQDTLIVKALQGYAMGAYQQALDLEPSNLEAKTGLGSALVSGSNNPMAGITLLQEVVKADPDHVEANKSLGLFSMQSRQFDKAIERFTKVISLQPDAASYFYLATSYENIGMKSEAIKAFEKSKQMAADPSLTQFIDRKIAELKN